MWTRSQHSSRGPAMVVPYRASLMLKRLPSPPPVRFGVMKHDKERREGKQCAKGGQKTEDSERMSCSLLMDSLCLGRFS